jgi:hypothetical protein
MPQSSMCLLKILKKNLGGTPYHEDGLYQIKKKLKIGFEGSFQCQELKTLTRLNQFCPILNFQENL